MDNNILLIFPIQLYKSIKYIIDNNIKIIYIIEESVYFTKYRFHKMKLAYHRATMKCYYDYIKNQLKNINIKYIEFNNVNDSFYKSIACKSVIVTDPTEHSLLDKLIKIYKNKLTILPTQNFLLNEEDLDYFSNKPYNHNSFYIYQRKRLNILVKNGKPVGGKWSYDQSNRLKIPKTLTLPTIPKIINDNYTKDSIVYVNKHFPNNYGEINFVYPVSHSDCNKWLNEFLKYKLNEFGLYQDALSKDNTFIFHSVLSPMMNVGLLTDTEVVLRTMEYCEKNKVRLESLEGFIRQIIGWRNYIYMVYMIESPVINISIDNNTNSKSYHKFWTGTTGIYPIDNIIKNNIVKYAYFHHIERLMVLGNFMKLCELSDDMIFLLFSEWSIDAYEWVMYPNILGMVLNRIPIMKRNYIASSNYIMKMGDYKKDGNWEIIFDCLYYNYINNNLKELEKDYALRFQISIWKKKQLSERKKIIDIAKKYIEFLNVI